MPPLPNGPLVSNTHLPAPRYGCAYTSRFGGGSPFCDCGGTANGVQLHIDGFLLRTTRPSKKEVILLPSPLMTSVFAVRR